MTLDNHQKYNGKFNKSNGILNDKNQCGCKNCDNTKFLKTNFFMEDLPIIECDIKLKKGIETKQFMLDTGYNGEGILVKKELYKEILKKDNIEIPDKKTQKLKLIAPGKKTIETKGCWGEIKVDGFNNNGYECIAIHTFEDSDQNILGLSLLGKNNVIMICSTCKKWCIHEKKNCCPEITKDQ